MLKKAFTALALVASGALFADGEAAAEAGRQGNFTQMLVMIGVAIAFFWLIVLRPERKRRKAAEERRNSLQKGDQVTAMGILGKVAQIKENTVILSLHDGAKMEVLKQAISEVKPATEVVEPAKA